MAGTDDPCTQRVREVVEATSISFVAQCYRLYDAPPLGSLVRSGTPPLYAVVSQLVLQRQFREGCGTKLIPRWNLHLWGTQNRLWHTEGILLLIEGLACDVVEPRS